MEEFCNCLVTLLRSAPFLTLTLMLFECICACKEVLGCAPKQKGAFHAQIDTFAHTILLALFPIFEEK